MSVTYMFGCLCAHAVQMNSFRVKPFRWRELGRKCFNLSLFGATASSKQPRKQRGFFYGTRTIIIMKMNINVFFYWILTGWRRIGTLVLRATAVRVQCLRIILAEASRWRTSLQSFRRAKDAQAMPTLQTARRRKRGASSLRRTSVNYLVVGIATTNDVRQIGLNALMRQIAVAFRRYFAVQTVHRLGVRHQHCAHFEWLLVAIVDVVVVVVIIGARPSVVVFVWPLMMVIGAWSRSTSATSLFWQIFVKN